MKTLSSPGEEADDALGGDDAGADPAPEDHHEQGSHQEPLDLVLQVHHSFLIVALNPKHIEQDDNLKVCCHQ